VSPVLPHTRASCAARPGTEELHGSTGTSSAFSTRPVPEARPRARAYCRALGSGPGARGVCLGLVAAVLGCGGGDLPSDAASGDVEVKAELPGSDARFRFGGSSPSLDALGGGILRALAQGDTLALEAARLTEQEHNEVLWPEMPAAAPEVNFPLDYAWSNIVNRSYQGRGRLLKLLEGHDLRFVRVECRGQRQLFETYAVETDCWVLFTEGAHPELWQAQLFKDVAVRGGGYKIFRYYDQEPRPYRS
jgi:hypothetical protein